MFSGVHYLSLDPKNRLAIPAKIRDAFMQCDSRAILTLESAQCLLLYPETEWLETRARVLQIPNSTNPVVKSYQRLILGYAQNIELDKVGRLLIPNTLRNMTKLERDVVLVGMGNRFEIWNSAQWDAETQKALAISQNELSKLIGDFTL